MSELKLFPPPKNILDILHVMGVKYTQKYGRHVFSHPIGWSVTGDNYMELFSSILGAHEKEIKRDVADKLENITLLEFKEMERLD